MVTIQDIIEKLGVDSDQFEIYKNKGTIENANLRLVGDKISISEFNKIAKSLTDKFGAPMDKDEKNGEKFWVWDIEGIKVNLYLFEQHCYKLNLTLEV